MHIRRTPIAVVSLLLSFFSLSFQQPFFNKKVLSHSPLIDFMYKEKRRDTYVSGVD